MSYLRKDYVLDNPNEFERLENQATQRNYLLKDELRFLEMVERGQKILDAGCGSGVLSRYIKTAHPDLCIHACDYSELRIQQAKKMDSTIKDINYHVSDLNTLPFKDGSFDIVISRFVFEYLADPVKVARELKRVLKKNGTLYLIDLDGVFMNFWTGNHRFNELLSRLNGTLDFDLFVGRKLPSIVHQAGFKNIKWEVSVHPFNQSEDIQKEISNNATRLAGAKDKFSKVLGGVGVFEEFSQLYIQEMNKIESQGNAMFFNKFIVWGKK
jgi:ubiquinone/menaquinone biosynthesis C-methylase UbiE